MLAETRFQQALGLWRGTEAYPQDRYADWAGPERDRLHGHGARHEQPLLAEWLERVDVPGGSIVLSSLDGLLEVPAPARTAAGAAGAPPEREGTPSTPSPGTPSPRTGR